MRLEDLPAARGVPSVSAARMARADHVAIVDLGIPEEVLMENAARAVATVAALMLGRVGAARVIFLAGRGNNGGDALAAARTLFGWGADVRAVAAHEPDRMRPAVRRQRELCEAVGVRVAPWSGEALVADLLVDGLLGYSGSGAPRDDIAEVIRGANRAGAPILAVDLPSGLHPDTGEPQGVTIRATVTVTLALPKAGLRAPAARPLVGELVLADIGIPAAAYESAEYDAATVFGSGPLVRITD